MKARRHPFLGSGPFLPLRNGARRHALASMSKESLEKQADPADNIADQIVLQEALRDAAREYRQRAKAPVYAMFKGHTQLTATYPSEKELMKPVSSEGSFQS